MHRTIVADVMATELVTAPPQASFAHLARLMHTAGVRAVPVVDPAGVLLGVVSEADLMASAARPDTEPGRWRARHVRRDQPEAKAGATTAVELMTQFVEAVAPMTTVATAARLMVERHLRWMPVCDDAGRVVGVISRSDLLAVFLRDDGSIRAEVLEEVLAHVQAPTQRRAIRRPRRCRHARGRGRVPRRRRAVGPVHRARRRRRRGRRPPHLPGRRAPRGRPRDAARLSPRGDDPRRPHRRGPCRYSSGQHPGDLRGPAAKGTSCLSRPRLGWPPSCVPQTPPRPHRWRPRPPRPPCGMSGDRHATTRQWRVRRERDRGRRSRARHTCRVPELGHST